MVLLCSIHRESSVPFQKVQSQQPQTAASAFAGWLGCRLWVIALTVSFLMETPSDSGFQAGDTFIDNGRLRLEVDPQTGWISSLCDLQSGVEVFTGPGARPVVLDDPSDTWSHNIFRFDRPAGEFRAKRVQLMENGPVRATLRVESRFGSSMLVQDFYLYRDAAQVEVRAKIDWHEKHQMLKLRFPLDLSHMRATYEIPYGTIERFANGEEDPGQSWVDVSGLSRGTVMPYGFSLLNDGKYSFDVHIRDLGMTVLRSPIAAHHMPVEPRPGTDYTYLDQGWQEFQYVLQPHIGSWEQAETVRRAAELNQPALRASRHFPSGWAPPHGSRVHPGGTGQRGGDGTENG